MFFIPAGSVFVSSFIIVILNNWRPIATKRNFTSDACNPVFCSNSLSKFSIISRELCATSATL
ncbi:MAG: hypothetical protein SPH81_10280 [Intestinibacter sp.]|nr:hypothetical protein [Intestinibacter sp.]